MKVLLDTNIIIHREATQILNKDIGVLFRWLDKGKYTKCIHPITIEEIKKNSNTQTASVFETKLQSYELLITIFQILDRKIHKKAGLLGISDRVFRIDSFLEKVVSENPELVDYKVLSVAKTHFGRIKLSDPFFDSFKEDYIF